MKAYIYCLLLFISMPIQAVTINVFLWSGEIPAHIVHQFKAQTGIDVRFSTYDSNEAMYAKLKASRLGIYDVIQPSGYFVERMVKQNLLKKINKSAIPNIKYLNPFFENNSFDPGNAYSVPIIWGTTGLFYNKKHFKPINSWHAFWDVTYKNKLLLLDDSREIFSIALMKLGYSPNDSNPQHIKEAYEALLQLAPNIKLFASQNIQSIVIDEDAFLGTIWNGDAYKSHLENKDIAFIYPKDGFVIWEDCLAIPHNAPHEKEALAFINFIMNPKVSEKIGHVGFAITNKKAIEQLPNTIKNSPLLYPSSNILKRGFFQRNISDEALELYNYYWAKLKLSL